MTTHRKTSTALAAIPVATILLGIAFVVIVVVGGVRVIQGDLGYYDYGKLVVGIAVGLGFLGVGRGIDSTHKP